MKSHFHLQQESSAHVSGLLSPGQGKPKPSSNDEPGIHWLQWICQVYQVKFYVKGHVFITSSFISKANSLVICFIFQPSNPPKTSFVHFVSIYQTCQTTHSNWHIFLPKPLFLWVLRELGSLLVYNIGIWMVLGDEALAHWWQQSWIVKAKLDFGVLKLYGILKTLLNSILALHLDASSVFLCSLSILWPFCFQGFDPLSDLPGDATMRPPLLPSTSLTSSSPLRSSTMSPLDSASATTN